MIKPRSLLVADEHPIVGDALITRFSELEDPLVVCQVYSICQLHEAMQTMAPCAVVGEVQLGSDDLLSLWPSLTDDDGDPPLIVFSRETDWSWIGRAALAGAYDYVFKSSPCDDLVATIHRAMCGEAPDPIGVLEKMKRKLRRPRSQVKQGIPLTSRELQVLCHVAIGMTNRQIARALGISAETTKEHVHNILRKLNLNDRTHAAMWAIKNNLIT